ncbi:hypothetical protein Tco_0177614 [Tanacetum coccineum]
MGLGGDAGDNTGEGGDSGSDGECIWGSGENHGESGDDGTGAGIEILAVTRYEGCGGGVAADSSVSNGSVSFADGA